MDVVNALGWVDGLALLGLLVSVLIGLWRGLVHEVMAVAGWVAAFIVAQRHGVDLAAWLPIGARGSAVNLIAGLVLAFVLTLFAWALLAWLLQRLMAASPLRPVDRLLGAAFGVLRALVIGLIVVWAVRLSPLAGASDWQASWAVRQLGAGLDQLQPWLPEPVLRLQAPRSGSPSLPPKG